MQLSFDDVGRETERYVRPIEYHDALPMILNVHYARRVPSIKYAFGLFEGGQLIGVVTYGVPASPTLCKGVAGAENQHRVLELNRLVIAPSKNGGNRASFLVGRSLKQLPHGTFVVSYADTAWTHVGYIYQATNFLYTGLSAKRKDTFQPNGLHSRNYNKENHSKFHQSRSRKHRYIFLVGNRREKREMLKQLKYPVLPYPKGNEERYDWRSPKPKETLIVYDENGNEIDIETARRMG